VAGRIRIKGSTANVSMDVSRNNTTRVPFDGGSEEEINTSQAEKLGSEKCGGVRISFDLRRRSRRRGQRAAPCAERGGGTRGCANRLRKRIHGIRLPCYDVFAPYPQNYGQISNLLQPRGFAVPRC